MLFNILIILLCWLVEMPMWLSVMGTIVAGGSILWTAVEIGMEVSGDNEKS